MPVETCISQVPRAEFPGVVAEGTKALMPVEMDISQVPQAEFLGVVAEGPSGEVPESCC
jgi:hypothetical protein